MNDFLSWHRKKELVLQPKFQRRDVWSAKAQSHLVDTIVRGFPIPILFVRQTIDPAKKKTIREVVDGQQRLRAVLNFCEPALESERVVLLKLHNPELAGKQFNDLPVDIQTSILSYDFSVVLLEGATDADILNIFARLNTYALKLTAQELLNAEFSGQFKQTVYGLGYQHLTFWTTNGILSDAAILRMSEAELVSDLVVAMLEGIQDKKKLVKNLYEKYEEEFPQCKQVERRFKHVMDIVADSFGAYLGNSIFKRKALFYTLFCVVFDLCYGMPKSPTPSFSKHLPVLSGANKRQLREGLLSIEEISREPHPSVEVAEFLAAGARSVTDVKQRTVRHKFVANRLKSFFC